MGVFFHSIGKPKLTDVTLPEYQLYKRLAGGGGVQLNDDTTRGVRGPLS